MENFKENIILINDLSSEKFKLRSPKGNKLYIEPHFNAFSKENLGSIPRNQENILQEAHQQHLDGIELKIQELKSE